MNRYIIVVVRDDEATIVKIYLPDSRNCEMPSVKLALSPFICSRCEQKNARKTYAS